MVRFRAVLRASTFDGTCHPGRPLRTMTTLADRVTPIRRPLLAARAGGALLVAAIATTLACGAPDDDAPRHRDGDRLVVFNAGSLALPLRAALDSFARREGIRIDQESAGSLETARKLTELQRTPDIIALADGDIFPRLLMPARVTWYARFAGNRMVLAYTGESRFASEMSAATWRSILVRDGVEVGRSDPDLDPSGYRALLLFQLAEMHYADAGLAARLLAAAPRRNVRPKEVELTGLLQAGELDYIWTYESVAQAASLEYIRLPERIDFSTPAESAYYARAVVRVVGATMGDTLEIPGRHIVYALSVPVDAPNTALAERAAAFLLSEDGARLMRSQRLEVQEPASLVGDPPARIAGRGAAGELGDTAPVRSSHGGP